MADLYDRLFDPDNDEEPTLDIHGLTASLNVVSHAIFTPAQAISFWNMDTLAEADFNALVTRIDNASGVANKMQVLANLEAAGIATMIEAITTKTQYRSAAGIT